MKNYGESFIFNFDFLIINSHKGFTLLEILVALSILGIAITVLLQLFSANLRSLSVSEDYVFAVSKAEAKMREILDDKDLSEKSWTEIIDDGYKMDVSINEGLKDRTENLQVRIFEVTLSLSWTKNTKNKSLTLRTMKVVNKKI
ncbi:MAG: type IV pilus modification PilV family protein [Thermodesulfovibrionales bacterium]